PKMNITHLYMTNSWYRYTIDYRLGLFLNATIKAFKGFNEEMSSMKLMVLQNRLVLDLLVAQEGGVCKMLNDTCCTFIPDNNDEGHIVTEALHQLEKVQSWRWQIP
uniref:ERVV2 protein n=1 Tax=Oryzias latipes TaxID=8090 RepID=A0A3B3ILP8_ORYLA